MTETASKLKRDRAAFEAAREAVEPIIAEMNAKYAMVRVGTSVAIICEDPEFELMTVDAFNAWLSNRKVLVDTGSGKKFVPLARYWREHPQRRSYAGIDFDPSRLEIPGKYNLWKGFPIAPVHRPGACDKFLAHLRDNICSGSEEIYLWVMGWFADIFQNPAPRPPNKKSDTALVLRGPQGTGKTKVGQVYSRLLGDYFTTVARASMITGTFNMHLRANLLFQAEEAFWAGSKEAEGIIKDLVTGDTHWITPKHVNSFKVKNFTRLLVNGNHGWIFPGAPGERRAAVLDVAEHHKDDHAYFRAIDEEMENGGYEELMWQMLHFDLTKTNIRRIPETKALFDQKLEGLDPKQGWWMDFLARGELPYGCDEPRCVAKETLFKDYVEKTRQRGIHHRSLETTLGIFINRHAKPTVQTLQYRVPRKDGMGWQIVTGKGVYALPHLKECRAMWSQIMKHTIEWDDPDADWTTAAAPELPI